MKEKSKKVFKNIFTSFIWLFVILLIVDIVTKNLVIKYSLTDPRLASGGEGIVLIPGFLRISYVINTSVAFGLGIGDETTRRVLFIIVALIIAAAVIFYYVKSYKKSSKFVKACIMLVLVGAFGNLIDRIFYSPEYLHSKYNGVVDWIDFYGVWKYVFNIADSCVVIGAIMLIIYLIVEEVKEYRLNKKKEEANPSKNNEKILSKDEIERLKEEKKNNDE